MNRCVDCRVYVVTMDGLGRPKSYEVRLCALHLAASAMLKALQVVNDELGDGILDWGDPNDLNDPESEYARAHRLAMTVGKAIQKALGEEAAA